MKERRTASRRIAWALALALSGGLASAALAAGPGRAVTPPSTAAVPATPTQLAADIAALQAQLAGKTAEISALKRAQRGMRDDYELRRRMAEANDLARRLTGLESELRAHQGQRPEATDSARPAGPAAEPAAAPEAEGASVLAARADLLSDEARKLSDRAAGMVQAAGQLRARQVLRRRAFNVERDAFAGLDGARRLVPVRPASPAAAADSATRGGANSGGVLTAPPGSAPPAGGQSESAAPQNPSDTGNSNGVAPTGTSAPAGATAGGAPPPNSGPTPPSTPPPAAPSPPAVAPPVGPTAMPMTNNPGPAVVTDTSKGAGSDPKTTFGTTPTKTELAPGAMLDPALRAELARIDGASASATDADALLRAAAALTNRAHSLEAEAKALRDRAARR